MQKKPAWNEIWKKDPNSQDLTKRRHNAKIIIIKTKFAILPVVPSQLLTLTVSSLVKLHCCWLLP